MILVLCSCQISNKYSIHSANLIFLATAELTWLFTRLNIFEFYSTSILDLIRLYFCWGKLSNGWFLQLLCFVKLDSQLMIDTPPPGVRNRAAAEEITTLKLESQLILDARRSNCRSINIIIYFSTFWTGKTVKKLPKQGYSLISKWQLLWKKIQFHEWPIILFASFTFFKEHQQTLFLMAGSFKNTNISYKWFIIFLVYSQFSSISF